MNHSLDWNEHIKQVAVNWLSKGDDNISLEPDMLMLFGNPDLFQENQLISLFEHISPVGVFFKATYGGCSLTYCRPLFGAPIVAMYLEVAARLGVKNIVACGYSTLSPGDHSTSKLPGLLHLICVPLSLTSYIRSIVPGLHLSLE